MAATGEVGAGSGALEEMSEPEAERNALVGQLQTELQQTRSQLELALEELQQLRTASSQNLELLERVQSSPSLQLMLHQEAQQPWWRLPWDGFTRGFTLGYGVRAGMSLATKLFSILRKGRFAALNWSILSESSLVYREDAVRLGLFCGGYSAVYHAARHWLGKLARLDQSQRDMLAGAIAGLCILFQSRDRRRTLALYTLARVAQCTYNSMKAQGKWHFWGSDWAHGDWLLFGASTAQIMWAYAMRPETLPDGYWSFIVNAGPIPKIVLKAIKASNSGEHVDAPALVDYCLNAGASCAPDIAVDAACVPCSVMHPRTTSCAMATCAAGAGTFRKTFPLYMSISLVPFVVFNTKRAMKDPANTLWTAFLGAARSTSFLASFVSIFQGVVCTERNLFAQKADNGLLYMAAGFLASLSLLLEKKSRRSELALYVLPRALDSLFLTLMQDRWVPSIHLGEVALFSACMGALMHFHNQEPDTMAPLVRSIITRIVYGRPPGGRLPLRQASDPLPSRLASSAPALPAPAGSGDDKAAMSPDTSSSDSIQWEHAAPKPPSQQAQSSRSSLSPSFLTCSLGGASGGVREGEPVDEAVLVSPLEQPAEQPTQPHRQWTML
eukprot:jgi/Tetstr1/458458/TSEL_004313.t1